MRSWEGQGEREEMESQGKGNRISKFRSPRSADRSSQSVRTDLVGETKISWDVSANHAKSYHVVPRVKTPLENCACRRQIPSTSSWADTSNKLQTYPEGFFYSSSRFVQSPRGSPQPSMYLTILNEFFKPERLTKLENKVKRRTIEALENLSKSIEEARLQQELLLQDSKLLQQETFYLETENNYFLRFLKKRNDLCKKKHQDLWNWYFRECGEMRLRRQELASMFAQQNADLQMQLLQGKSTQFQLKQQVQSLQHINSVKKSQEMKIQALQEELENMKEETAKKDQEAFFQFLQQKIPLDRQMQELKCLQLGQGSTKEAKSKARALASTAKKVNSEMCARVCRENQGLQEEFMKQVQEYHKLESLKRQLEDWKETLKEEQWYQEALVRGRHQLKADRERSHNGDPFPKEQGAPRPH
ncbi:coiled-coil domain-containing protein 121 [Onychomys torridus]|uniref:coiled-coil domain-containing protein 121 n=1 Tax=Onychomys torridus TaxID=38674 RepID=UPI00167F715A|nr:coiled-coil domain-containing protein 121 [Onychomys torridus]